MTSATLFREGPDLDALLAELDAEYPGRVRVVDVQYGRAGGVLGFFAHRRVAVHYQLTGEDEPTSLDELLGAQDHAEPEGEPDADQVEFARMLLELATAKAAERRAAAEQVERFTGPQFTDPRFPSAPAEPVAAPEPAPVTPLPQPVPAPPLPPAAGPVPAGAPPAFASPAFASPALGSPALASPAFAPPEFGAPFAPPEFAGSPVPEFAPVATRRPAGAPAGPLVGEPVPSPRPAGAHRARVEADQNWGEYALRRRLIEIGVPVEWIPEGADNAYWVIEQLARRVPTSLAAPATPGHVVVVAGPGDTVLAAARDLAARLRLDPASVQAAGCLGDVPADHRMELWNAGATAAQYRTLATAPLIVAVALDGSGTESAEWGRQVVRALVPDRVHVVVDAGRKTADAQRTIGALPHVHSLFVTGAAQTASPASVWELGVPVEMLDGRPATQGGWAALLIDALAALDES